MANESNLFIILPKLNTSYQEVIAYGQNVKNGLADNVVIFDDPTPTVAVLTTTLDALITATSVPYSEQSIASKNLARKLKKDFINDMLKPLSTYVLQVANGDRYTAGLSGFKLNKETRTPIEQGEIAARFISVGPDDGTSIIEIMERGNNDFFVISLKVGDTWVVLDAFKKQGILLKGLPSGSSIIRIIGKKGDVPGSSIELVVKAV